MQGQYQWSTTKTTRHKPTSREKTLQSFRKERQEKGKGNVGIQWISYQNTEKTLTKQAMCVSLDSCSTSVATKLAEAFCWPTVSVLSSPSSPHFCLLLCAFSVLTFACRPLFLLPFLVQPRHPIVPSAPPGFWPFASHHQPGLRFVLTLLGPSFCVTKKLVHSVSLSYLA